MVVVDDFFNSGAVFIFHIGIPELYGIFDPAFSNSACADAESMFQSFINMNYRSIQSPQPSIKRHR